MENINIDFCPSYILKVDFTGSILKMNNIARNRWIDIHNIKDCFYKESLIELETNFSSKNKYFLIYSRIDKKSIKEVIEWKFFLEDSFYFAVGNEKSITTTLMTRAKDNQKFEAIGQMAAGIAHEVNSPSQFVANNLTYIEETNSEIFNFLDEIKLNLQEQNSEAANSLLEQWDKIDVDFLKEDLISAISESKEGLGRIKDIVKAMRDFSHTTSEFADHSILRGLNSTITIAKNEWKYECDLENNVDSDLPTVNCNLGKINQVFLNLILNATHSIKDAISQGKYKKGKINIDSKISENFVIISVSDNGLGIPEQIQNKIFDSFFTTKKIGIGTGQGLSISKEIIENIHNGKLYFETEIGKGTTFYIELPLDK